MIEYPIIGFAPDLPQDLKGNLVDSDQVLPTTRGIGNGIAMQPASSITISGRSLGGAVLGDIASGAAGVGDVPIVDLIGTATKLYWLTSPGSGGTVDVSGATYHATTTDTWSFAQFGRVSLAVNKQDALQASDGIISAPLGLFNTFTAVSGAPKAAIVVVCGGPTAQFTMLFNYTDGANNYPDGIFWAAKAGYTNWTPSILTECANIRLIDVSGGFTAAIAFRDGVVAFKRRAMYLGTYEGPPGIWRWTRISADVGCIGKNAVCEADDALYFVDEKGVWMYDGSYPRPVPGYVHNHWANNLYQTTFRNFTHLIWKKAQRQLWLGYGTAGSVGNTHLVYNIASQLWTRYGKLTDKNGGNEVAEYYHPDRASMVGATTTKFLYPAVGESAAASFRLGAHGNTFDMQTLLGVRPQFLAGPADANATWLSGSVYYGQTLRNITDNSAPMAFSAPDRLNVVQEARFISPVINVAANTPWECSKIALDLTVRQNAE